MKASLAVPAGAPERRVSKSTLAPAGVFRAFYDQIASSGDAVAFTAEYATFAMGVFKTAAGATTPIALRGDPAPAGSTLSSFILAEPSMSGDIVAFAAESQNGTAGLYLGDGGPLTTIALEGQPAPLGTFTGFRSPSLSGNQVAFRGEFGPGSHGIFIGGGGSLTTIVQVGDSTSAGTLESLFSLSFDGAETSIGASYGGGKSGAFLHAAGVVEPVVKFGDALFGGVVDAIGAGKLALDPTGSGRIAFYYQLQDGQQGIAVAVPVPEPACLGLVGVAMVIILVLKKPGVVTARSPS